jgi:hypothetical protein
MSSRFPNRRWLVIPSSEVDNIDFGQVLEAAPDSLRYSIDGTQTFVKYEVTVVEEDYEITNIDPETELESTITVSAGVYGRPSIYNGVYQEYDHAAILALLAGEDWTALIDESLNNT